MSHALAPFPTLPALTPGNPTVLGPAGWHLYDDIQTVAGLGGSFLWSENPFFPTIISFDFVPGPDPGGQFGTYTVRFGLSIIEQGPFYAVPNNPASGLAFINLNYTSMASRAVVISAMLTDSNWRINSMLLTPFVGNNPGPVSFSALRVA